MLEWVEPWEPCDNPPPVENALLLITQCTLIWQGLSLRCGMCFGIKHQQPSRRKMTCEAIIQ